MKILFLCGSLEAGRDGVGDYTTRLACELNKQGHQTAIIALRDKHILENIAATYELDNLKLSVFRISFTHNQNKRCSFAREWIDTYKPEWISIQYVPFSFQEKGLHNGLGMALKKMGKGCRWHMMFHELWVGRSDTASVKKIAISYLQELKIGSLLNVLKPSLIHTQLPIHQFNLKRLGVNARPLPLFSNIPQSNVDVGKTKSPKRFKMAFFSQVSSSPAIIKFIDDFSALIKLNGLEPELLLIGGKEQKMLEQIVFFKEGCPQLTNINYTGFLNTQDISQTIADCDLGITPLPLLALGKSGSIAAFFAHGIPIAAPSQHKQDTTFGIGFFIDEEKAAVITKPDWENFCHAREAVKIVQKKIQPSAIAQIFNTHLLQVNPS